MTYIAAKFEIKREESTFHLLNLYKMVHEWVLDHEYAPETKDSFFPETFYFDSNSSKGKEIWVWWRPFYVPEDNPYYKRVLNIDFHAMSVKEVEVMHEGQKFKTNYGQIKVLVQGIIETDYDKKWRDHWLLRSFNELFWKRIFWRNMEIHKKEVYDDAYDLQNEIKNYLDMQSFMPEKKAFWPARGLASDEK